MLEQILVGEQLYLAYWSGGSGENLENNILNDDGSISIEIIKKQELTYLLNVTLMKK